MIPTVTIEVLAMAMKAVPPDRLTLQNIMTFGKEIPNYKIIFQQEMKPKMIKAGFEFAPDLYSYRYVRLPNEAQLIAKITFEDTNREGKTVFMNMIAKTGIFDYSVNIIKPYS